MQVEDESRVAIENCTIPGRSRLSMGVPEEEEADAKKSEAIAALLLPKAADAKSENSVHPAATSRHGSCRAKRCTADAGGRAQPRPCPTTSHWSWSPHKKWPAETGRQALSNSDKLPAAVTPQSADSNSVKWDIANVCTACIIPSTATAQILRSESAVTRRCRATGPAGPNCAAPAGVALESTLIDRTVLPAGTLVGRPAGWGFTRRGCSASLE